LARLRPARPSEIAAILEESHGLWGAGLTHAAYLEMWLELMATPWGRRRFRYLVWAEGDGPVLSSFKLYRPEVRLLGRTGPAAVIGAVFTPAGRRRRGHAADMIRAAILEARQAGDPLAMLFTDIGKPYYAALGFRALPAEEASGRLDSTAPPPPGWELRPMTPSDLSDVIGSHDDECLARPLAVQRDREHWEFLLVRAHAYFSRFDGTSLSRRYRVATFRRKFAGYLVALEGEGVWAVREVGAPGADPAAFSAILRAGGEEARSAGLRKIQGWLPREAGDWVPEWRLVQRTRRNAIPMVLPLDGAADLSPLEVPGAAYLPYLDQF